MGEVHLARRKGAHGFEKLIALKTIRPDLLQHEEMRRMFLDEARLLARLDYPAVAQVYDFVEQAGGLYLALEYVPGVPLSKLMQKRQGPLPPAIVARIGVEVCRGLHAAHELADLDGKPLGVVHRDVSPQNVMLTFDGRIKILDFGVAFMFEREATTTQTGLFKGKLAYIAPEQIAGQSADRRSNLYSLAVVMHELLTGRRLFSKGKGGLADATTRRKVPKPSTIIPSVPKQLETIVMKGLMKVPRSRYADAKEMAAALEAYLSAAGGESLESFAERELEEDKEHHRNWLQSVMDAPTGPTPATQPDQTKADRPAATPSKTGEAAGLVDSALISFVPERPRKSGRMVGLAIILAALTAGAWLLFPSLVEENASRFASWATDEAKPMISDVIAQGADAFDDDPEIDRTEQERIEEEDPDPEALEATDDTNEPPDQPDQPPEVPDPIDVHALVGITTATVAPATLIGTRTPPPPEAVTETPPIPDKKDPPPPTKVETPPPRHTAPPPRRRAVKPVAKRSPPRSKKLIYGTLSIAARPGGAILVDGHRAGATPLDHYRLKAGRHRVALTRGKDPKPRWSSTVWIREGKHVLIKLR